MKYLYVFLLILLSNSSVSAQDCVNDTIVEFWPVAPSYANICIEEDCLLGTDFFITYVWNMFVPYSAIILDSHCFQLPFLDGFVGIDRRPVTICNSAGECNQVVVDLIVGLPPNCLADTLTISIPDFLNPAQICLDEYCSELAGLYFEPIPPIATTFGEQLTYSGEQCVEYVPWPGFVGTDTLSIKVCNDSLYCDTLTLIFEVGLSTSIDTPNKTEELSVYPNPAKDIIYFTTPHLVPETTEFTAVLYDFSGKMVREVTFAHHLSAPYQLDVSGLSEGIYFLKIREDVGKGSDNGQAYRVVIRR